MWLGMIGDSKITISKDELALKVFMEGELIQTEKSKLVKEEKNTLTYKNPQGSVGTISKKGKTLLMKSDGGMTMVLVQDK